MADPTTSASRTDAAPGLMNAACACTIGARRRDGRVRHLGPENIVSTMKEMMPLMASGEGIWDGEYIYVDPMGVILDRHKSRLYCMYPDEEPDIYRQKNVYTWADGREVSLGFEFRMQESGRLKYKTLRTEGEVWEENPVIGEYPTIRLTWQRSAHPGEYGCDLPNARIHELIQQLPEQGHRARIWQWFIDDRLVQRTLITETRVSRSWR